MDDSTAFLSIPGGPVEIGFQSIGPGDCSIVIDADEIVSSRAITILINHIYGVGRHHKSAPGDSIGFYRIKQAIAFASQLYRSYHRVIFHYESKSIVISNLFLIHYCVDKAIQRI